MFGGKALYEILGQYTEIAYGSPNTFFGKSFYYSVEEGTVKNSVAPPAPISEIHDKMSPKHFDSLGGHSMIVHSQGSFFL